MSELNVKGSLIVGVRVVQKQISFKTFHTIYNYGGTLLEWKSGIAVGVKGGDSAYEPPIVHVKYYCEDPHIAVLSTMNDSAFSGTVTASPFSRNGDAKVITLVIWDKNRQLFKIDQAPGVSCLVIVMHWPA